MSGIWRIFGAFLAVLTLGACAITEDVVPVTYEAQAMAAPIVDKTKTIKLMVTDDRGAYRGQIGAKVNGWGQEMAAIRSTVPVREILENAVAEELSNRNISVDNSVVRALEIAITAMHNNFKVGFVSGTARGIVTFNVSVIGADAAIRFNTTVSEIHEIEGIALATGDNAAKAVEGALAKAMKTLFENDQFIAALVDV